MVREIKFRAWDKNKNRMLNDFTWVRRGIDRSSADMRGGFYFQYSSLNGSGIGNILDFEIMQYTSLKDKNEKEIYEGDIVKSNPDEPFGPGPRICVVVWQHDRWWYEVDGWPNMWWICKDDEVIGNIYENPDLLSESLK